MSTPNERLLSGDSCGRYFGTDLSFIKVDSMSPWSLVTNEGEVDGSRVLPISGSVLLGIGRAVLVLSIWVIRRPFLLSRGRWLLAFAGIALLDLAAWRLGWALGGLALLVPVLVVGIVVLQWWWLGRGSAPIVFVSLFRGRSAPGREVADTHFGALCAYLRSDPNLKVFGAVAVREIPLALSSAQAERLLRVSGAVMVIRGSGDAVADTSRWEWWAHFRERPPEGMLMKHEYSVRNNSARRSFVRRLRTGPPTAEAHDAEGDLAVKSFVTESVNVRHFRTLAMILCILMSEVALRNSTSGKPVEMVLPDGSDANVSGALEGRALALRSVAKVSQGEDHLQVLVELQAAFLGGAGDEGFAIWLTNQWFAASVERRVSKQDALVSLSAIVDRFPSSPHLLLNVAGAAVEARRLDLAEGFIDRAETQDREDSGIARLQANIAWERGKPALALSLYKAASRGGSPQTWQMGDCHAAMGQTTRALRCYRKVLRKDATANDALLHARALVGIPLLLPTMPGGWRDFVWKLLHDHPLIARPALWVWRRRRPEDPWLPSWLARQAIVVGDLDIAREWLILTSRKTGTNRLMVGIDALVVARQRGEGDPRQAVDFLRQQLDWLESSLPSDVHDEALGILGHLIGVRPDLFTGDVGSEIRELFAQIPLSLPVV